MFKKLICCIFLISFAVEGQLKIVDSDVGQFEMQPGSTACTLIALHGARHILSMDQDVLELDVDKLGNIVRNGIEAYRKKAGDEPDRYFDCGEVIGEFPDMVADDTKSGSLLEKAHVSDEAFAHKGLSGVFQELEQEEPACSIITKSGETYALCRKGGRFVFIDSHRNSEGESGSHAIIGSNTKEIIERLNTYHPHLKSLEQKLEDFKTLTSDIQEQQAYFKSLVDSPEEIQFDSTIVRLRPQGPPMPAPAVTEEVLQAVTGENPLIEGALQAPAPVVATQEGLEEEQAQRFWQRYPRTTATVTGLGTLAAAWATYKNRGRFRRWK